MSEDDLLPMMPACDLVLADLAFQFGEATESQLHEAIVLETAGVDDLSDLVRALARVGAAALRGQEAGMEAGLVGDISLTPAGYLRNLRRDFAEQAEREAEGE